jgi:hypothetical protein
MTGFKKLLLAFTVMGASTAAFASDDNFAGLTFGQTSDKVKKSHALNDNLDRPNADGVIGKDSTWGLRLGRQNGQGRYYATYDNVSGSMALNCVRKTCWAATICSTRGVATPSCSVAYRPG